MQSSSTSSATDSQPMDIPAVAVGDPLNSNFINTPEQYLTPSSSHATSNSHINEPRPYNAPATPRRSRPGVARSVSSPLLNRRRANTSRIPSGLVEIQGSAIVNHGEQWTVFGQLMEDVETPMRSSRHQSVERRRSRTPSIINYQPNPNAIIADPFEQVVSPVMEELRGFGDFDSDSDSDSETHDETGPYPRSAAVPKAPALSRPSSTNLSWLTERLHNVPVLYRNIIKCAVAYFIASMFTFNPYLSSWIRDLISYGPHGELGRPLPSGHMVATVAVYFHPAKTVGAMLEADMFFIFGVFYSAFVCLSAIGVFWWLETQDSWGLEWLGDVFIITWIGVSITALAWMKVRMANPQFNTACSMMAIIIFVVLVKEGGWETLIEVSSIVSIGALISNVVCLLLWPQTATSNLQGNMIKTLDSFSTLLSLLTTTFLLEDEEGGGKRPPSLQKLQIAAENHQNSFTGLKKNLGEAKNEWSFSLNPRVADIHPPDHVEAGLRSADRHRDGSHGKEDQGRVTAYEDAVDSLNRLAQHLNGLRGGTRLQFELTKAGVVKYKLGGESPNPHYPHPMETEEADEERAYLKSAAALFGDLVDDLGPPLKALSTTCTSSLKRLRESFVESHTLRRRSSRAIEAHEFLELVDGIERALTRFESTSNHAVMRLYRRSNFPSTPLNDSLPSPRISGDVISDAQNEHVFLVYFFIFTLQEFARELVSLIDAMERIYTIEQSSLTWGSWAKNVSAAVRHGFWRAGRWLFGRQIVRAGQRTKGSLRRRLSRLVLNREGKRKRLVPSFPKVKPHAPNTIQTPARSELSFTGRLKQRIWTLGRKLGERDSKYAVKVGVACAVLSAGAFFDSTRPLFVRFWGDWALISLFVVMSPTIGATNYLSLHRILGTIFGATVAVLIYTLFPDDAVILSIFGFLFSMPCFYWIVSKPQYMSAGRFILLTYNLTCLYCFNIQYKDVTVSDVGLHRAIAVAIGVVYAAFVSRFWWPAEARRELSRALSEFCLNLGWLYMRLVVSNSYSPEYKEDNDQQDLDPEHPEDQSLIASAPKNSLNNSIQEFMAMELHLQIKLIELQGLLAQTQHEPRLKGPFPVQLYRGILTSLQTILDKLHSMRCVTTREEWHTSVRKEFILPVNKERREMVGNIILFLSTLSSAFRLKAPLPPYLPPAEKSRQNLAEAIRQLDIVRNRDVRGSRQLLFFAYVLTMKGVTEELEVLGHTLQEAFGVIGQSPEEFEALFLDPQERISGQT